MSENKVEFEIERVDDVGDSSYVDFNIKLVLDSCEFWIGFSCELDKLKKFADAVLSDTKTEMCLHGGGCRGSGHCNLDLFGEGGSGYCNLDLCGEKIKVDCNPGHTCRSTITFDKKLLTDFCKEAIEFD